MIKQFTLGAVKWTVELNNERCDDKSCYGESDYAQSKIMIQDKSLKYKRSHEATEQVLYHEVGLSILDTMCEMELSEN